MDIEKAVGAKLKVVREKQGISQEKLGFDAGIHRTYVSLIERGVKNPTLDVLFRLCQALGVPPAQFVRNVERRMEKKDKENAFGRTASDKRNWGWLPVIHVRACADWPFRMAKSRDSTVGGDVNAKRRLISVTRSEAGGLSLGVLFTFFQPHSEIDAHCSIIHNQSGWKGPRRVQDVQRILAGLLEVTHGEKV